MCSTGDRCGFHLSLTQYLDSFKNGPAYECEVWNPSEYTLHLKKKKQQISHQKLLPVSGNGVRWGSDKNGRYYITPPSSYRCVRSFKIETGKQCIVCRSNCLREVSNIPIAHDMKVTNKQEMIKIPVGHLRVISEEGGWLAIIRETFSGQERALITLKGSACPWVRRICPCVQKMVLCKLHHL